MRACRLAPGPWPPPPLCRTQAPSTTWLVEHVHMWPWCGGWGGEAGSPPWGGVPPTRPGTPRDRAQVGTVDHFTLGYEAKTYSGCLDSNFVAEVGGRLTG